jgi:DNA-nicking Smr family endonuclease
MTNEEDIFRDAVKGVKPLKIKSPKIQKAIKKPKPIAKKFIEDEKKALLDSLSDDFISTENESGEELRYLKKGHSPDILNKLKKGYWVTQQSIDLHGLNLRRSKVIYCQFHQ